MIYEDKAKILGHFRICKASQDITHANQCFDWLNSWNLFFPLFFPLKILNLRRSKIKNWAVAEHHFTIDIMFVKGLNLYIILVYPHASSKSNSIIRKFKCRKSWIEGPPMELWVEAASFKWEWVLAIRSGFNFTSSNMKIIVRLLLNVINMIW